jgi:hypothetical protein
MDKKIVLIDGHSILNRAFYGLPDMTTSQGEHTNAVLGFINIMFKILDEEKPDYLAVAFDTHHPTFRHEMYTEYKGTRKGMPEELREQVPVMKEVLKAMKDTVIEKPGFEADDILGTLARTAEKEGNLVALVSGDRDLLQLASKKIKIRIPKTKRTGTEIEDYLAYSLKNDPNDDVLSYLQACPDMLLVVKKAADSTALSKYPTPRGWTKVQELLNHCQLNEKLMRELIAGIVGSQAAASFYAFMKNREIKIPSTQMLLENYQQ